MSSRPTRTNPGTRKPPTIIDVAEAVGVSPSTVSRAITAPDLVAKRTREKIEAAVARIGFVPNRLAGGLASSRSHNIVFVVPSISLTLFNESVQLIRDELSERGYQVLIVYGRSPGAQMEKVILDVLSLRPDGVVIIGATVADAARERLMAAHVPVVEAWDMPADPIDMVAGFSHKQLGSAIGEYLLERGYRRPMLVWSTGSRAVTMQNALSYAFVHAGHAPPLVRTFKFPPDFADGREALRLALEEPSRPDVIVCLSDLAAHGVIAEARRRKLRVPQAIAVMGFGDLDFAADIDPPLTTVRVDQVQLGHAAAQLLLQRLDGTTPPSQVVSIEAKIVARKSA